MINNCISDNWRSCIIGLIFIMIGPPGSGKSMLAKRLPSILPPLSLAESLETTQIHSVAGKINRDTSLISQRPFRAPHHTISQVALVGGGNNPQPGFWKITEIILADYHDNL